MAKPMGTPWRKYSMHSRRKFRLSAAGRSLKLVLKAAADCGVGGGESSRENSGRSITLEVCVDVDSRETPFFRISICDSMLPPALAWPFVCRLRLCRLARFLTVPFLRFIWVFSVSKPGKTRGRMYVHENAVRLYQAN